MQPALRPLCQCSHSLVSFCAAVRLACVFHVCINCQHVHLDINAALMHSLFSIALVVLHTCA